MLDVGCSSLKTDEHPTSNIEHRMLNEEKTPLIPYASHLAHGTGRTPIGIILFAASHLLLGAVLLLIAWIMSQQLARAPARVTGLEWLAAALIALAGVPMLAGGVALLLKGRLARAIALVSFVVLAAFEA